MQSAALEQLGLGSQWSYEAIDIEPAGFADRIHGLPDLGFAGVNVTVPHKEAALRLADSVGDGAAAIGAANTLVFESGAIRAENTDAPGLIDAIGNLPAATRALVLGAGGAARAALWALLGEGADVAVWNRTLARAEVMVGDLGGSVDPEPETGSFGLIVNASAAGLGGEDAMKDLPLDPAGLRANQTVVDMVYGDRPSRLLDAAGRAGARTIDGLEILVRQGARSLEIWTGLEPSLEVMRIAARA
jgi:shikimate dehydrogenase